MMQRRTLWTSIGICAAGALLSGCSAANPASTDDLRTFTSMDEAFAAVDEQLDCDPDAAGEPVVPHDDGQLTSDQALCLPHVQLDLYPDHETVERALEVWSDTRQGDVPIAHGSNWMVVDLTEVATGEPSSVDLEGLASATNAEYDVVGD